MRGTQLPNQLQCAPVRHQSGARVFRADTCSAMLSEQMRKKESLLEHAGMLWTAWKLLWGRFDLNQYASGRTCDRCTLPEPTITSADRFQDGARNP